MPRYEFRRMDRVGSGSTAAHDLASDEDAIALSAMTFDGFGVEVWRDDVLLIRRAPQPKPVRHKKPRVGPAQ